MLEYISIPLSFNLSLKKIIVNSLPLSTHILFGLRPDLPKIYWNTLTILTPFLSFKGTTQAYLVKISITHKKNLNPSLNLLINSTSAKSVPQILSLDPE